MINSDRHNQNLIVRHRRRSAVENELLPNDHSHLLVSESSPRASSQLMACLDAPPAKYVYLQFVRESIRSPQLLFAALERVERLSERDIRAAVASTPSQLLGTIDRAIYADFLVQRRALLKGLLQNAGRLFPNLEGSL